MSSPSRARSPRRWLFPIVVLAVAGVLFWWGRREQARDLVRAQRFASSLCAQAPYVLTGPGVPRASFDEALADACRASAGRGSMEVRRDDGPDARSPDLYLVVIRVDERDRLGVRVSLASETPIIVGYWRPNETPGEEGAP